VVEFGKDKLGIPEIIAKIYNSDNQIDKSGYNSLLAKYFPIYSGRQNLLI